MVLSAVFAEGSPVVITVGLLVWEHADEFACLLSQTGWRCLTSTGINLDAVLVRSLKDRPRLSIKEKKGTPTDADPSPRRDHIAGATVAAVALPILVNQAG